MRRSKLLRAFRYVHSLTEVFLGVFLGIGSIGLALKVFFGVLLLFRWWSPYALGNVLGDALAGLIVFFIVRWLLRDGQRVWELARATKA